MEGVVLMVIIRKQRVPPTLERTLSFSFGVNLH